MSVTIRFLGTAGDSVVCGKQNRSLAGILLTINGKQLHIDPGPGTLLHGQNVDLRDTMGLLVSSPSLEHANDVNAVIDYMTLQGNDKHGVLIATEAFLIEPLLSIFHKDCLERVISLLPGKRIGIEDFEILALPTVGELGNIGFKIFTNDLVIVYTSSTGYSTELVEHYSNADVLICNVKNSGEYSEPDALSSIDVVKLITHVRPRLVILTGFGQRIMKSDPIYEAREIQKSTGVQVIAAKDGMVITPAPYSLAQRQQTLRETIKNK